MEPAVRLLRLLTLLPARPTWSGQALAERLGTTTRTVRRDVTRLRELGYAVDAEPGPHGGYRLRGGSGGAPPLTLDDEEAVAVAVGLRTATATGIAGLEEAAVTALAKLERTLPARLRPRVAALAGATEPLSRPGTADVVAEVLTVLAHGCRAGEQLRFAYRDGHGERSRRRVSPHRLVPAGRRWYLVAFDADRDDWRTFRVDRISDPQPLGLRGQHPAPPDATSLVAQALAFGPYRHVAVARLALPVAEAARRVPSTMGTVESDGPEQAVLQFGADDLSWAAHYLLSLGCGFDVVEPAQLRAELARLGARLTADFGPASPEPPTAPAPP